MKRPAGRPISSNWSGCPTCRRRQPCPTALPIGTGAGPLSEAAAGALGLTTACVVGVGLIDAHAGGLGVLGGVPAAELDRRLAMIAGTSTCHMAVSPQARPVPGVWGPYFDAMVPGLWLNEGGQSASGALLDHVLDLHAEGRGLGPDRHDRVSRRIDELLAVDGPAMLGPLTVLPDFHGNRSPLADPEARGLSSACRSTPRSTVCAGSTMRRHSPSRSARARSSTPSTGPATLSTRCT